MCLSFSFIFQPSFKSYSRKLFPHTKNWAKILIKNFLREFSTQKKFSLNFPSPPQSSLNFHSAKICLPTTAQLSLKQKKITKFSSSPKLEWSLPLHMLTLCHTLYISTQATTHRKHAWHGRGSVKRMATRKYRLDVVGTAKKINIELFVPCPRTFEHVLVHIKAFI